MLAIVFLVNKWSGTVLTETDEIMDARFFNLDELPDTPEVYRETLEDLQRYDGCLILK